MYFEIIQTIAEIAGTLIGFVGIVFVLGQRAVRTLTVGERNGLYNLLAGAVGTLLISILIMILLAAIETNGIAWRVGSGVVALYMFTGASTAIFTEIRQTHSLPAPLNWLIPATASSVGTFATLAAFNVVQGYAPLACAVAMLTGLVVAVTYFINLLTGQGEPTEHDA